jgi:hypothetical protein
MSRQDNIEVPAPFRSAADARGLGAALRQMQSSSAIDSMRGKALVIGVYEQGAVIGFATDPEPFGFRFDTVETFIHQAVDKYVNGGYLYTDTTCWLTLSDGRTYRVKGRSGGKERHIVEDFREMADRRIAMIHLPRAQAALRDGKTVPFGDITVGPDGLSVRKLFGGSKTLAWTDIDKLEVKSGYVKIKAKDRRRDWTASPVEAVPNVTTLASLIHAASSGAAR